ncbi:peptidoglycan editing factor PgeF [Gluconacetobacter sp. 1b LMG 1731]|uniref:Purine nucleoside phosphorylase n=1 Tax=Gluconacetobacter dulcium TaxID=2729096 RepID=A0A7W4ILA5_9PROT|nr:peptidoglycan editing factor PgeF [Gluconacetobacter dulcium]MBB2164946.1 peptidoglycan editing factor PgeF [Gluconacetobacter dulcium]MBB2193991.1 peptidoglycan editing factor PgeF [Gluconacetobacter dulcium]
MSQEDIVREAGTIPSAAILRHGLLDGVPHGFFTRQGGVSQGPYASLNCSTRSGDDPAALAENRRRVARAIGVAPAHLLGVTQVHGDGVVTVTAPWPVGQGAAADAMVTDRPGLALGVITADCGPVLFASADGRVVGAAHAGWRGAVGGVLEATLASMAALGTAAAQVRAVVGPCIGLDSYEVGADMRAQALAADPAAEAFFHAGRRVEHFQFDLAGYCVARLRGAGVGEAVALGVDTLADAARFFSHRRRTLAGGGPIGHQISVIAPAGATGLA